MFHSNQYLLKTLLLLVGLSEYFLLATIFGTAVGHYPLSVSIHLRLCYDK